MQGVNLQDIKITDQFAGHEKIDMGENDDVYQHVYQVST